MKTEPGLFDGLQQEQPTGESPSDADDAQWRRRAVTAEARLEQVQEDLDRAAASHEASERRHEIERLLHAHGALDVETALVMTEAALARMDKPDAARAVDELKRTKPFLFPHRTQSGAMSEHATREHDPLAKARTDARSTGDRKALLAYLRLKRAR